MNGRNALHLVVEESRCLIEQFYILSFMVEKIVMGLHSEQKVAMHNLALKYKNQSLWIVNGLLYLFGQNVPGLVDGESKLLRKPYLDKL